MAEINNSFREAVAKGLKRFSSDVPCKFGHIGERYVKGRGCVACIMERDSKRQERAKTDPLYAERRRQIHRESKARARATDPGKQAHYIANKRYVENNRDKVRRYYREKRKIDADFKMASWCRGVLHKLLKRQNLRKDARCVEILGYTGQELRVHIERQFTRGMSWEKMGKEIHIDHITPVAHMIRNGETRPEVIHALSNLRPMWAKENIRKSDAITHLV